MATMNTPRNAELVEQILQQVDRRVEGAERQQLVPFVQAFYSACATDELQHRDPQDVYATTYALWRFVQQFDATSPKISLFNPDFEQHGWQSQRTVLAALVENSPFIVDSIRIEMNRRGIAIHNIHSATLTVARAEDGTLQGVQTPNARLQRRDDAVVRQEALVFMEVTRQSDPATFSELNQSLHNILVDVRAVVADFKPMRAQATELAEALKRDLKQHIDSTSQHDKQQIKEVAAFLNWMVDDHFTFLGYQSYAIDQKGAQKAAPDQLNLGLFSTDCENYADDVQLELNKRAQKPELDSGLIAFSKSAIRSSVHRHAYADYVCVQLPDENGQGVIEHRFLGLYTSKAYSVIPCSVPLWRGKVAAIEQASGLDMCSHDGKELRQIINTFPRDEIVHSSTGELLDTIMGVWKIQERRKVRMFLRPDRFGKFISAMVYTPRDMYKTEVRTRIEEILWNAFGADDVDFTTYFSESILTRTHFEFRVNPEKVVEFDGKELRQKVTQAAQQWSDRLDVALTDDLGEELGTKLARRYDNAFPPGYQDDFDPRSAIGDIKKIECLNDDNTLEMKVYRVPEEPDHMLHFRLYHMDTPLALSDLLPPLENMGVRVVGDRSYQIQHLDGKNIWMHDFSLSYGLASEIKLEDVREKFQQAFRRVWEGDAESDAFNKLLLGTQLDWRECALLRAYACYMRQIGFNFRDEYIAETLGKYLTLTDKIVSLFKQRFDPEQAAAAGTGEQAVMAEINAAIDDVDNLNEDSIFRQYLALIKATLRTNYFQRDDAAELKGYFSFKLQPSLIPDVPAPVPMFEIFVYSPHVEGVHLRGGKVARGGLRWSDRREDFRTEVLGLVKAQQVKNSVIVPVGAKGGFVAKTIAPDASRQEFQEGGIAAYKTFISGLLDITDNIIEGKVQPPEYVVRHDEDDPYLVVAADKGTATFSDIANGLSEQYNFWLGDAFASGGSIGYDHKGMGITAKGAWVSVQRHFRERGIDVQKTDFSVVGIGDMMGDVFGNGMLLSEHTCLKAAFNHLHIFIDPTPDAASSFAERQRLFKMDRSSWDDYTRELISAGGGIFLRSAKSIPISPEMKQAFDLTEDNMAPNALIKALLQAPVDLLWNGGIGTYIKASSESHADVGDKANDVLRVDGADLRCKVIGEGGNLGVTQLGRIEFALNGGAVNTDFIDNAAGVDCSDHEVNIKILLNDVIVAGDMTEKQRRSLLEEMTDEVGSLVLRNNYMQVQAISIAESEAKKRFAEYRRLMNHMVESGKLDRELEFLPNEEQLLERDAQGKQLSRPELSVLISYIKSQLKEDLCCSDICENAYVARIVQTAFPGKLSMEFPERISSHKLRCEIIATQLANDMVNHMGITFVDRMRQAPGISSSDVALAYVTARDVFSVPKYWRMIEELDHEVDAQLQMRLMADLMRLMRRASHWFLRNRRAGLDPEQEVLSFRPSVNTISENLGNFLKGHMRDSWQHRQETLAEQNIPPQLAHFIAAAPSLYSSLSIAEAAKDTDMHAAVVADTFFSLGDKLDLHWFHKQISDLGVKSQWQAMAREAYRDDLEAQQGSITTSVLMSMDDQLQDNVEASIESWLKKSSDAIGRWQHLVSEVRAANTGDFSVYTVANRALTDLAEHCQQNKVA